MKTNRNNVLLVTAATTMALLTGGAMAGTVYYTGTSRINNSNGLLTFSDITQNGQTLVNYMDQGLTVNVNDFAFIFTPCGFNNSNIYYPNGGVTERIEIFRTDGQDINILEMNASHGFGGCDIWMWISVYNNNQLIDEFDELVQGGTLIGLEGTFDRVVVGSYADQATRDQHDETALNAMAIDNMEYESNGGAYTLTYSGSCPGAVTVGWSGAQPNAQQGLVVGQNLGAFTIPQNQPCGGTVLGVQGQVQLVTPPGIFSTGPGNGTLNGNAGPAACGRHLQLVHGGTCDTSNVVQIQ